MKCLFHLIKDFTIFFPLYQNKGEIHFGWQRKNHPDCHQASTDNNSGDTHLFNGFAVHMAVNTCQNKADANTHDNFEQQD